MTQAWFLIGMMLGGSASATPDQHKLATDGVAYSTQAKCEAAARDPSFRVYRSAVGQIKAPLGIFCIQGWTPV